MATIHKLSYTAEQIEKGIDQGLNAITTKAQTLIPEQQAQARDNIGAAEEPVVVWLEETDTGELVASHNSTEIFYLSQSGRLVYLDDEEVAGSAAGGGRHVLIHSAIDMAHFITCLRPGGFNYNNTILYYDVDMDGKATRTSTEYVTYLKQTVSEEQKAQARENIGAAAIADIPTDYVKNTDYAGYGKCGIVGLGDGFGIGITSEHLLQIEKAQTKDIDDRLTLPNTSRVLYRAITPANLDYAVKAVGDGYYVRQPGNWELIDTINVEEGVASLSITQEPDGTPYQFSRMYIRIELKNTTMGGASLFFKSKGENLNGLYISGKNTARDYYTAYEIYPDNNYWRAKYCDWTSNSQQCGTYLPADEYKYFGRAETKVVSEYPTIDEIRIAFTFPANSKITIWGVRA